MITLFLVLGFLVVSSMSMHNALTSVSLSALGNTSGLLLKDRISSHMSVSSPFPTMVDSYMMLLLLFRSVLSTPRHSPWQGHVCTSDCPLGLTP